LHNLTEIVNILFIKGAEILKIRANVLAL